MKILLNKVMDKILKKEANNENKFYQFQNKNLKIYFFLF